MKTMHLPKNLDTCMLRKVFVQVTGTHTSTHPGTDRYSLLGFGDHNLVMVSVAFPQ
jgi:hypothetical protein